MSDHNPPAPRREDFQTNSRNPFASDVPATRPVGSLANAEQQRSIAEVQARMIIARSNPRDPIRCMDLILRDCTRPSLAEKSLYQYARGGSSISGPSIRLAEAIAQRWGNIASGIKEISRSAGFSECVAYAWDLESGFYDERQYQVKHWRDTKGGGYQITDERDIYELVANMGQRRKRAVLLTVIPGDVVEAAQEQCEETLRTTADTSPEALARVVAAFDQFGVTKAQLEKRCQCRFEAVRAAQIVQLRKIFASLKDGMSEPADWFDAPNGAWAGVEVAHTAAKPQTSTSQPRHEPTAEPSRSQATASPELSPDEPSVERDSAGVAWDAARHASSKAKNTDGTWRARRGVGSQEAAATTQEPTDDGLPFDRWDAEKTATIPPAAILENGKVTPVETMAFSAYLLNHEGEGIGDDPIDDPVKWAEAYVTAKADLFPDDVEAFETNNHDAAREAMIASTDVSGILAPKRVTDSPKAVMGAEPVEIDPAFVPAPTKPTKAEYDSYMARLEAVLAMEDTDEWVTRVEMANLAVYGARPPEPGAFPEVRRLICLSLVADRRAAVRSAPEHDAIDFNALAYGMLKDIASWQTVEKLDQWRNYAPVKGEFTNLLQGDATLHQKAVVAFVSRRVELRTGPETSTPTEIFDELQDGLLACGTEAELMALQKVKAYVGRAQIMDKADHSLWVKLCDIAKKHLEMVRLNEAREAAARKAQEDADTIQAKGAA